MRVRTKCGTGARVEGPGMLLLAAGSEFQILQQEAWPHHHMSCKAADFKPNARAQGFRVGSNGHSLTIKGPAQPSPSIVKPGCRNLGSEATSSASPPGAQQDRAGFTPKRPCEVLRSTGTDTASPPGVERDHRLQPQSQDVRPQGLQQGTRP
eukprot:212636-Chlamydomonas_euryale.AAC.1